MVEYWKKMIFDSWAIYKRNLTLFFFWATIMVIISFVGQYVMEDLKVSAKSIRRQERRVMSEVESIAAKRNLD